MVRFHYLPPFKVYILKIPTDFSDYIATALADHMSIQRSQITGTDTFFDLGADELDTLVIALQIEDDLDLELSDAEIIELVGMTVDAIAELIKQKVEK